MNSAICEPRHSSGQSPHHLDLGFRTQVAGRPAPAFPPMSPTPSKATEAQPRGLPIFSPTDQTPPLVPLPSSTRSQFLCFCVSLSAPDSSLFLLSSPLLFLPGSPPPASLPCSPLSLLPLAHTPPLGPPLSLRLHFLRRRGPGSPVGGPAGSPGLPSVPG